MGRVKQPLKKRGEEKIGEKKDGIKRGRKKLVKKRWYLEGKEK